MERPIKRVILHCSATPDEESDIGAEDIELWHKARRFSGIGYHFVIKRDGTLEHGRPLEKIGAHTKGHNLDSIGVCYVGTRKPTDEQIETLLDLAAEFNLAYGLCADDWFGHYQFANKECPGVSMELFRAWLRSEIA